MGLREIVKEDLKRRKLTWTKKAPQAVPNKKEAERLAARQRGYQTMTAGSKNAAAFTMPGSYRK
jgi:hypothetical protein